MADLDAIKAVVYAAIDELNEQQPADKQVEKSLEAPLFGKGAKLDSLALVNLIVEVEGGIADELDAMITLVDEKAMSQKQSPFRTVGALSDYIAVLIDEEA